MARNPRFGLHCPHCNHHRSRVVDSQNLAGQIRRTRHCHFCGRNFPTHEAPMGDAQGEAINGRIVTTARRLEALDATDRHALLRILDAFEAAKVETLLAHGFPLQQAAQ